MHLTPSDPDIATLVRKIKRGRLDLQPNFQRGEVWGKPKKQRLIDSILRGWHIPPIHVIQVPSSDKQEVLDGQQRLAAIRDFMEGEFFINGNQDPADRTIIELDGKYWDDLPPEVKSKIEDFTVRLLTISDYNPGEPGELFYRLNQPTNLTSAEQRNAYFGEARQQVKDLSEYISKLGFDRDLLGFSNSRMAYDDVISKFLLTLENETLKKKITANSVTSRYRDSVGFDDRLIKEAREVFNVFYKCISSRGSGVKLNKAAVLSWLIFIRSYLKFSSDLDVLGRYFSLFESLRKSVSSGDGSYDVPIGITRSFLKRVINVYQDRSSSRVADTSSVILRDFALWLGFVIYFPDLSENDPKLQSLYRSAHYLSSQAAISDKDFDEVVSSHGWGGRL